MNTTPTQNQPDPRAMQAAREIDELISNWIRDHNTPCTLYDLAAIIQRVCFAGQATAEDAAKLIDRKARAYHEEHGSLEPDTGTWNYPKGGEDYINTLEELAEEIRALKPVAPATSLAPSDAEKIARELAEKFLRWPLPESVCADLCATKQGPGRVGTNLLSFIEAQQMMQDIVVADIAPLAVMCSESTEQANKELCATIARLVEENTRAKKLVFSGPWHKEITDLRALLATAQAELARVRETLHPKLRDTQIELEKAQAERDEHRDNYQTLTSLLHKRFPMKDGVMPDYKVEDVLRENEDHTATKALRIAELEAHAERLAEETTKILERIQERFVVAKSSHEISSDEDWLMKETDDFYFRHKLGKYRAAKERKLP